MIDIWKPDYQNTPASSERPSFSYRPFDLVDSPAVSIVTPFYNEGFIFQETARSVFQQSLQQWEWIIVDDQSDNAESLEILDEYANRDPRIQIVRTAQRSGPGAARNLGVRQARAPFIAFLDSDDLYEPTALEKWAWFLESHKQFGFVKGYQVGFGAEEYLWREGFHDGELFLTRNCVQTASMIRRNLYVEAGGMDESIRGGFEDWDFWLKLANRGHWGTTVHEFLDWYRRRAHHGDRWENWDGGRRTQAFHAELRCRYPKLYHGEFPKPPPSFMLQYESPGESPFFTNRLGRREGVRRLLMIVPHLALGGADKFNLDMIELLTRRHGWEITVVSTLQNEHVWRHRYESLTPDVFTLETFLRLCDYPRFLRYLIRSRGIDAVLITHSALGYELLPFLRAEFPELPCYDYIHIEEPGWRDGGYPRQSIVYEPFLDKTIASSEYLSQWVVDHGGNPSKMEVVTTNVDCEKWTREGYDTAALRRKYQVPENTPVLLFAGRLHDQKQPDVLAQTIKSLRERGARFVCLIAGNGPWDQWLQQFVAKHSLSEARLLGARPLEEVQEMLAISDIFFLPSKHEGISLAIFEAMAMGVVPVGADVGGQRELVTPDCGVLIPLASNQTLHYVEAIVGLLMNDQKRSAMGRAARERVARQFRLSDAGLRIDAILRGTPAPFDQVTAFHGFSPGYAREIIERRRVEIIAEQLWTERNSRDQVSGSGGIGATAEDLRFVASLLRGNPLAYQKLLTRELARKGNSVRQRMALALSPHLRKKWRNERELWADLLSRPNAAPVLGRVFDAAYYTRKNPDVPEHPALALLHYIFHGSSENRRPSEGFDLNSLPTGESARGSLVSWLRQECE